MGGDILTPPNHPKTPTFLPKERENQVPGLYPTWQYLCRRTISRAPPAPKSEISFGVLKKEHKVVILPHLETSLQHRTPLTTAPVFLTRRSHPTSPTRRDLQPSQSGSACHARPRTHRPRESGGGRDIFPCFQQKNPAEAPHDLCRGQEKRRGGRRGRPAPLTIQHGG